MKERHILHGVINYKYKALIYGGSLAGIMGSSPAGDMDVCLLCVVR